MLVKRHLNWFIDCFKHCAQQVNVSNFAYNLHISFYIVDIDECATNVDTCVDSSSTCVNTPGAFRCDCKTGFNKLSDFICAGKTEMSDYDIVLIENIKV